MDINGWIYYCTVSVQYMYNKTNRFQSHDLLNDINSESL